MTSKSDDNSESLTNMGLGRRQFLAGTAGAAGAGALGTTIAPNSPVGRARALAPLALGAGYAVGIAAAYAARRVDEYLTGDDFDEEEFAELNAEETHALVRELGMDMGAADDSALTNLQNVLDTAENAAYNDAQGAAVEQMDLGNSEQDTIDAATEAVDGFYTTQQENLLDHVSIQNGKIGRLGGRVLDSERAPDEVWTCLNVNGNESSHDYTGDLEPYIPGPNPDTLSIDLVDGSSYQYDGLYIEDTGGSTGAETLGITDFVDDPDSDNSPQRVYEIVTEPVDTGSQELAMDRVLYRDIWTQIQNQHDTVVSDITSWVESVYSEYEEGDINLEDLVTTAQFSESAAEETGFAYSTADLAAMGVPISDAQMVIDLPEANDGEGTTVEGMLSTRSPPDGGLDVGTEYDPANISGPVWLAYNYEQDGETASDLINLEQPFTITEAETADGESLDTVTFESRNQRTLETDIDALNEELQQLREYQEEMQERQKEAASGGGGGFLDDPASLLGLGAIGALLAAVFLNN